MIDLNNERIAIFKSKQVNDIEFIVENLKTLITDW